jgi:hypothetical protein
VPERPEFVRPAAALAPREEILEGATAATIPTETDAHIRQEDNRRDH